MALSAQERRAKRDARAQTITNPDTGQPFRNYNQLDTWQRNQRAKAQGFKTRAQKRYTTTTKPLIEDMKTRFPNTFETFLGDRKPTETLARQFQRAFGKRGPSTQADRNARKKFIDSGYADDFDWRAWRNEYASI